MRLKKILSILIILNTFLVYSVKAEDELSPEQVQDILNSASGSENPPQQEQVIPQPEVQEIPQGEAIEQPLEVPQDQQLVPQEEITPKEAAPVQENNQEEAPAQKTEPQKENKKEKKHRNFFLFKRNELTERQRKEYLELKEKQRKEDKEHKERLIRENKEALDRINKEKAGLEQKVRQEEKELLEKRKKEDNEIKERHLKEQQESSEKYKSEKKEKEQKQLTEKLIDKNITRRAGEEKTKNALIANEVEKARGKQLIKLKKSDKVIEVIRNNDDPLYITDADVLNGKTAFLGVKDIEFKYRLRLENQTPKVINSVLLIWERKLPFTESQTLMKETKFSKPILPYEYKIFEYNEMDSKRGGELYRVKIAKVIFEDGTQWKNPL